CSAACSTFLCVRPRRRSVHRIVVSKPGWILRSIGASLILAKVMPFRVAVSSRSKSSWPDSSGLRWPPILPGSVLPVSRTRATSWLAPAPLTATRSAAPLAELPPSAAPTSRFRRSWDKGAAITASSLLNRHWPPSGQALLPRRSVLVPPLPPPRLHRRERGRD